MSKKSTKSGLSNYEIIAINDSSSDGTGRIIKKYSFSHSKVTYVENPPLPQGWTGKNWACYQGYFMLVAFI